MLDRKATVTVLTLAALGFGGGAALAATHAGSHASASQRAKQAAQIRAPKLVKGLVSVHVCHPGEAGSRLDALN